MRLLNVWKKKPEGDYGSHDQAGYADPGYQGDKKPRYPLKEGGKWSEERIRAAWNYINKGENSSKYSDGDAGKIKDNIVSAWKEHIDGAGPPSADKDASKAAIVPQPTDPGCYVYRPVLNGDAWAKWAQKCGIPNALDAGQMHVSVLYSRTTVKMVSDQTHLTVLTEMGRFCGFGPDENVLAFTWDDWGLSWRNSDFMMAGAVTDWPIFRPHFTISMDAEGFDLTQEMIDEAPQTVILGPEVWKAFQAPTVDDGDADDLTEDLSEVELSAVKEIQASMAGDASVLSRQTVRGMLLSGKTTAKSRVALFEDESIGEIAKAKVPRAWGVKNALQQQKDAQKSRDVEIRCRALPAKAAALLAERQKSGGERQVFYGWASVSTIGGEYVRDYEDAEISVSALHEFSYEIGKTRDSKFEHQGAAVNTVVENLVFDDELQKALGIDLGFEGLLVGIHIPDTARWADIKKAEEDGEPYELSIAARVKVVELD